MWSFSALQCLLLVHVFFALHVHILAADDIEPDACEELSNVATSEAAYTDVVSRQNNVVCSESPSGFVVWSRWTSKREGVLRVAIRRCLGVSRIWINIEDGSHFLPTSSQARITSCNTLNDTVFVPDDGHSKVKLDVHSLSPDGVRIIVMLEVKDRTTTYYTTHKYRLAPESKHRHHREKREAEAEPPAVSDDANPSPYALSECGHNRTCIRFGSSDCDHMTCDYFLSYHTIDSETLDMELSGKTEGWVAIGFSSDNKMGGGDDVISCKRSDTFSDQVQVEAMTNVLDNAEPKAKSSDGIFNVKATFYQNGFLYCRVTRPLKVHQDNKYLDLNNDWYQLYARGKVASSGAMLQHEEIPPTSDHKITALRMESTIMSSASHHCLSIFSMVCVLLAFVMVS